MSKILTSAHRYFVRDLDGDFSVKNLFISKILTGAFFVFAVLLISLVRGVVSDSMLRILGMGAYIAALAGLYLSAKELNLISFSSLISTKWMFRISEFSKGLIGYAMAMVLVECVCYLVTPESYTWRGLELSGQFQFILAALVLFFPQVFCEELLLRSYLTKYLSQYIKADWLLIVIIAVLFSVLHFGNREVLAAGQLQGILIILFAGILMGVITLLTGGIEEATGLHYANNIFMLLLVSNATTDHIQTSFIIADLPVNLLFVKQLIIVVLYFFVIRKLISRKNVFFKNSA